MERPPSEYLIRNGTFDKLFRNSMKSFEILKRVLAYKLK